MLSVQPQGMAIGVIVLAVGLFLLVDRRDTARWLYRYYQSLPERNLRPRWLWHVYRPSEKQAQLMAWLFAVTTIVLGGALVISALR